MKTQFIKLFILSIIGLAFLNSCTTPTYRYRATSVKAPMFSERGEFQIGATDTGIGGIHGAVAITDHLGLAGGISWASESDSISVFDTISFTSGEILHIDLQTDYEVAAMYFNKFPNGNLRYEIQVGFAFDERTQKTEGTFDLTHTDFNFTRLKTPMYTRLFIQPAIGRNYTFFDWNFATRIQWITYKDLKETYPLAAFENYSDVLFEPVATVRAGFRHLKFMYQLGLRIPIARGPYAYTSLHMGVGLVYTFRKQNRKE